MLKLYHFVLATCGIKVRLVVSEKGISVEEHVLDPDAGDLVAPEYIKLNPGGVVPTLVHDDLVLTESTIIMRYLEDVFPEISLTPKSAVDRASMNMWLKLADECYLPALGVLTLSTLLRLKFLAMGDEAIKMEFDKTSDPKLKAMKIDVVEKGLESDLVLPAMMCLRGMLDRLEHSLGNSEYLAGNSYSLADAALTPFVYRLSLMNLLEQPEVRRDCLVTWWTKMVTRPSFEEVIRSKVDPGLEEMVAAIADRERPKLLAMMQS